MSKTTIVFYQIINDKEDKNSQNVFYISKPINTITLNDIKNEFPLIGTYHFRFKILLNNTHVWVDINDDSSSIPSLNSCIYAKVLRLSWLDHKKENSNLNEKISNEQNIEKQCESNKIISGSKEKNTYDNIEVQKSKSSIDMLLFETTSNKSTSANTIKRNDNTKDQNYFDLMFN
ncbi:conserved Plasmodium protein, unknown function [Plasmodium gallinaceum]|uniref:DIX domain-containing protein n=1 Tax=Plasmodium gallinaceum TaxID=5849 RepID=A0A1J1GT86_PLAGA|nr:conserved Plasmodium protein, unknown function [Plasmodium gallinaceum]CRG95724.1 conserved Plasmodium protein, unknown function [Plasmodium gallinaceum]